MSLGGLHGVAEDEVAEALSAACGPGRLVWPKESQRSDVHFATDGADVDHLRLRQTRHSRGTYVRDKAAIRTSDSELIKFCYWRSDGLMIDHAGAQTNVRSGAWVLSGTYLEERIRFDTSVDVFVMTLPRTLIVEDVAKVETVFGLPLNVSDSLSRPFFAIASSAMKKKKDDGVPRHHLAQSMISLAMAMVMPNVAAEVEVDLYGRLCAYAVRHLRDPDLDAEALARVFYVSPRTVQREFAARGVTPSLWIKRERLRRIVSEARISPQRRSMTSIAFEWGMADTTHLRRDLKTTLGV